MGSLGDKLLSQAENEIQKQAEAVIQGAVREQLLRITEVEQKLEGARIRLAILLGLSEEDLVCRNGYFEIPRQGN